MKKLVSIVIPIYKEFPNQEELFSLKQCIKILSEYDITVITHKQVNLKAYRILDTLKYEFFDYKYFIDIKSYNKLMLSLEFYERFNNYKYILIYQLDCFVFKDELAYWCEQDYDYIGAPWLRDSWSVKLYFYTFWNRFKKISKINFSLPLFINKTIGNGGLSLRKVDTFIYILKKSNQKHRYLKYIKSNSTNNHSEMYNEDVFWAFESIKFYSDFSKPKFKVAVFFAVDSEPNMAFKYLNGKLPFACHGWSKAANINFWREIIKFEKQIEKL
ncbi:MAG: DUF5672 family protein [Saprospiraceae bacterium]|nr:DUF5672 family protein [Saprospiraceae bacterium]